MSYLLRTIRAKHEDSLVLVGQRDTVHESPNMAETSGGELDTGSESQFGVTGELRVSLAIMQEVLGGEGAFQRGEQILGSDTMACREM